MSETRCSQCGRWFKPGPGRGERQVTCLAAKCQSEHKKILDRKWHWDNPEGTLGRQGKIRDWSLKRGGYWAKWRDANEDYVERNREQTRERMRRRREAQQQARAILANPVGYLSGLRADVCKTRTRGPLLSTRKVATADDVCKTRTRGGVLVGMVDYLIAREMFAKHEPLAFGGGSG